MSNIMKNKTYSYKKISHFSDILLMSNKQSKINTYTDKQFEEDLKKWFSETKTSHSDNLDKFIEHFK